MTWQLEIANQASDEESTLIDRMLERTEMITELEQRAGGVQPALRLLGVSQSNWYDYRAGKRPIPAYIESSIAAHMALSTSAFKTKQRLAG